MILDRKIKIPVTHFFTTSVVMENGREIIYRTAFRGIYFEVRAGVLEVMGKAVIEKLVRIPKKRLPLIPEYLQCLSFWSFSTSRYVRLLEQHETGLCKSHSYYQEKLVGKALLASIALHPTLLRETFLKSEKELWGIYGKIRRELFGELHTVSDKKVDRYSRPV